MRSNGKKFDLNIEKILEDWEVHHPIREIIANALDEQLLTGSKNIDIFRDAQGKWHIRDYGRGLKYQHLTQKENEEKLRNPNIIGKFGIGLKDALATFERNGVKVLIKSRFGEITLDPSSTVGNQKMASEGHYDACTSFLAPPASRIAGGTTTPTAPNGNFSHARSTTGSSTFASATFPGNTSQAIGLPSPAKSAPATTCLSSGRRSRE